MRRLLRLLDRADRWLLGSPTERFFLLGPLLPAADVLRFDQVLVKDQPPGSPIAAGTYRVRFPVPDWPLEWHDGFVLDAQGERWNVQDDYLGVRLVHHGSGSHVTLATYDWGTR